MEVSFLQCLSSYSKTYLHIRRYLLSESRCFCATVATYTHSHVYTFDQQNLHKEKEVKTLNAEADPLHFAQTEILFWRIKLQFLGCSFFFYCSRNKSKTEQ